MKAVLPRLILLPTLILLAVWTFGQQAYVKVIDQKSREPVGYAHVCFEGINSKIQKYYKTDMDGKAPNDIREKCRLAVSFIGFETYQDTIRPGQTKTVELKPTVTNMQEVVITAQYTPEKADKSIYKVNVINSRQIEQRGATNLGDVLKNETGLRVSDAGVLGTTISLQGLSGENVKFLVDGVPIIGRMDGILDLNQINMANVDHIEVVEGPMSVQYGSNAMAGVINIIMKENKASNLGINAETYWESFTLKKGRNTVEITAGRNFFQGYSLVDTSRVQTFKPRRQWMTNADYIYSLNSLKIKVSGNYFNELQWLKGPMDPVTLKAFDSYPATTRYTGKLDLTKRFNKKTNFSLLGAWSSYSYIKTTYYKDLTTLHEIRTTNPDANDTTNIYSWMLRSSVSRYDSTLKLGFQTGVDLNSETGTGKKILDKRKEIGEYAAFVSLKYDPFPNFSVQPAIRGIRNTRYNAPLVYSLCLKWSPMKDLTVRPTYSKGFKSPSLKQLYLDFVDINHNVHGNPDLEAEYSDHYDINLNYTHEMGKYTLCYELGVFRNNVDNAIELARAGNGLEYNYFNIGMISTQGFQFSTAFNAYPGLNIKLGMSETGIRYKLKNGTASLGKFSYSPDVSGEINYKYTKHDISLSLYYKYTGSTPEFRFDDNAISSGMMAEYNTMDITASKGFLGNRLKLTAGLKNLFDNTTIAFTGDSGGAHGSGSNGTSDIGWGRTFFIRLAYTFNKYN
ncbi:MAG: TonB-dependent receptor [Bacteroidetes bacterium]|nr:TonB-dependent receptor [Bacteroidota bacterium]